MTKRTNRRMLAVPALGFAAALAVAGPAAAAEGTAEGELTPLPLNGATGSGTAMLEVNGTMLTFTLASQGLLADAPHAAHIHFGEDAENMCPTEAADTDGDGFILTPEGAPAYGGIQVSLTTEGDTSPDSALAVDRFAVGPDFEYTRTDVPITEELAASILAGNVAVVVHGVDVNGNGTYDMEGAGPSPLDPALPAEATMPALCGILSAVEVVEEPQVEAPAGGVQTGAGTTAGVENGGLIAAGTLALLAGAATLVARRRTANDLG